MSFNRYCVGSDGAVFKRDFVFSRSVQYDDVVDRSSYRPDSEQVRQFSLTGSGSSGSGVYDNPDNMPSDLEVKIRSGKLDKAEINQILKQKTKEAKKIVDSAEKEKALEEAERLSKARQDFLDKKTGFTGSPVED